MKHYHKEWSVAGNTVFPIYIIYFICVFADSCRAMLLRTEDLSSISGISMQNAFIIGDQIIGVGRDFNKPWAMYSIDMRTFAVKEMLVDFHDIDNESRRCNMHCPIVVHNDTAYAWINQDGEIAAGVIEDDKFHWRIVETSGQPALPWASANMNGEGDSSKYFKLFWDEANEQFSMYELDLLTRIWERKCDFADDKELQTMNKAHRIWATCGKIHLMSVVKFDKIGEHLILDFKNQRWSTQDDELSGGAYKRCFRVHDQLYKIVRGRENQKCRYSIFRFEDALSTWIKVYQLSPAIQDIYLANAEILVAGSRIFLFNCVGPGSSKHLDKVYVFELQPTLLDYAQAVVLRGESCRDIGKSCLPRSLISMMYRDDSGDKLAPKGKKKVYSKRNEHYENSRAEDNNM